MLEVSRIIDANLNRACEGLRVIEDFLRFRGDTRLFIQIRDVRHSVSRWRRELGVELIGFRLGQDDPGRDTSHSSYSNELELIMANLSRVRESLRVLEESFRLRGGLRLSDEVQKIRFRIYELESLIIGKKRILTHKGNLYLIFDIDLLQKVYPGKDILFFVGLAEDFFKVGVDILQVRFSDRISDRKVLMLVREIKKILPEGKILFINNRPDLAYLAGVNIHVGQDDISPRDVRRIIGFFPLVGQSCHKEEEIERALSDDSVDYFTIGPIFSTQTKPEYVPVGVDLLEKYWRVEKPFVVIGGLSAEKVKDLIKYKPWAVAVCRDLLLRSDYKERVKEYKRILERYKNGW